MEFRPADWKRVKRAVFGVMSEPVNLTRIVPETPHTELEILADFEVSLESWRDLAEI